MKDLLLWELKQRRAYTLWWSIIIILMVVLLISLYPSIRSQGEALNATLNQLPSALRELKTGGSQVDITSAVGYLNSQLYFATLPLLQIIMAIGLGSSMLGRDERNKTLELILARPIRRRALLAAKAWAGIVIMVIVAVAAIIATITAAKLVDLEIGTDKLIMATLYSTLFSMSFGVVAYAMTAAGGTSRRSSIGVATALSFGSYLLTTLGSLTSDLAAVAKFLPYNYYDPSAILLGQSVFGLNIYLLGIFVVGGLLAWQTFERRDIS